MVTLFVDNIKVDALQGSSVFQVCSALGKGIPYFCFHKELAIGGNCRMCLVEVKNSPKPVASCAMPVIPGIEVYTSSPLVLKSREAVLEFLLVNHPLDCPICDQGGECDLQNHSILFGSDRTRFFFKKRSVSDKWFSPLVRGVITRCIQCTRCVRYYSGILGKSLSVVGRGSAMEISSYYSRIQKEVCFISGNVVDLCPVGFVNIKKFKRDVLYFYYL